MVGISGEMLPHRYLVGGVSCLAGDRFGEYYFPREMKIGDRVIFTDMAIYSFVKNNTFNGIPLPSIYILHEDGEIELVKKFGYDDFKGRLGRISE